MLSYDRALKIAREKKSKINRGVEYENAYSFYYDDGIDRVGGENPIVVMKETGETFNFVHYAMKMLTDEVRRFEV